jgi:hypothetical protein
MDPAADVSVSPEIWQVPLALIQTDDGSQARVKIHTRVVRDYAEAMRRQLAEGELRFPPVILFF